jgi:hypothetical protein
MRKWLFVSTAAVSLGLSLFASPLLAQNNEEFLGPSTQRRTQKAATPTPRRPDGSVNLGTVPGQKGHWIRTRRELVAEPGMANPLPSDLKIEDVPFQPWAQAMWDYRHVRDDRDSPHARCKPDAGPRQIGTAYGFEIVDLPELKQVYIFDIGGPQTFRTVYMDGRTHPADFQPTFYGHSVGRWEGDTLVVDSVGFNEKNWIDAMGLVHTDQYHQLERFTRLDSNTLKYEVTVDDPGAYTAKWTAGFHLRWNDGAELFEYICQQNNLNPEMVIGDDGTPLSRKNVYTP